MGFCFSFHLDSFFAFVVLRFIVLMTFSPPLRLFFNVFSKYLCFHSDSFFAFVILRFIVLMTFSPLLRLFFNVFSKYLCFLVVQVSLVSLSFYSITLKVKSLFVSLVSDFLIFSAKSPQCHVKYRLMFDYELIKHSRV